MNLNMKQEESAQVQRKLMKRTVWWRTRYVFAEEMSYVSQLCSRSDDDGEEWITVDSHSSQQTWKHAVWRISANDNAEKLSLLRTVVGEALPVFIDYDLKSWMAIM